ncbi:unnamed protein product, partial [marine sediment metagenome]
MNILTVPSEKAKTWEILVVPMLKNIIIKKRKMDRVLLGKIIHLPITGYV